ncbi:(2Fe-2S)-binding protein [Pseudomonas segetis]
MVLAYDDPKRAIGKRVRLDSGRIIALRLAGETSAQDWLKSMWREAQTDDQLRRWLLAPLSAAARQGSSAGNKTLCNCMSVSQQTICDAIGQGMDLNQLKQNLGCGTSCGSCVPEIKRLLQAQLTVC